MFRSGALFLAVALAGFSAFAQAPAGKDEPDARGYLTAFACAALPAPLRLQVEAMDNTSQNLKLRDVFVQKLAARGAELADAATLSMSIEVEIARQATRLKPGDLMEVRVGGNDANTASEDYARVRMNVWSSSRDSLLAGRREGVEQQGFDILKLRASLNSKTDGRCLWQGEIMLDLEGEDPYRAAEKLMPVLAEAVGKAANRKPIRLD